LARALNLTSIELKQPSEFMNSFFQQLLRHLAATFVGCCFLGNATGADLQKLTDIVASSFSTYGSGPSDLTKVGETTFFSVKSGTYGAELWKTDGTAAGTVLVKDIYPGTNSSDPQNLTAVGGTLYFTAEGASSGRELWKSDGTFAGTVMVKDIYPGSNSVSNNSSNPENLTAVGSTLYFSAQDSINGRELRKSDGTTAGTVIVKDIYPGTEFSSPNSGNPRHLTAVGSNLYFLAVDASNGIKLWKTDGTVVGTILVKNIQLGEFNFSSNLAVVGATLYFPAFDDINGLELWKSDGTAAGTILVKDINPGTNQFANPKGSEPKSLTSIGGTLYFQAYDDINGQELWKSDGTVAGTVIVKDINAGPYGSLPENFTAVGNALYFAASTPNNGKELWKSDGTAAGTVMVKDIGMGSLGSNLESLTAVGSTLYFQASDDNNGTELWKSDGTAANTVLVKDIYPGDTYYSNSSYPKSLTTVGSTLYFVADNGINDYQLWKSDGTVVGTVMVKIIYSGMNLGSSTLLKTVGGTLYFTANNGFNDHQLWRSDGTPTSTVLVKDINSGYFLEHGPIQSLTAVGSNLYFSALNGINGRELWTSDGTEAGTALVKDIYPGYSFNSGDPRNLTGVGSSLYFTGLSWPSTRYLFKSDGTEVGTVLVKDIYPDFNSDPQSLTAVGSTLYFTAKYGINTSVLWKSDGTESGTVLVKDIYPDTIASTLQNLTAVGNTLYFTAQDFGHDFELWKSDGTPTGTVLVKNFNSGYWDPIESLTAMGSTLYFSKYGELWKSDGTTTGTVLVKGIYLGGNQGSPDNLTVVGNTLYFTAKDGSNGRELWKSDGTAAGTILVKDIYPGTDNGSPLNLIAVGSTLYFSATNGGSGRELWKSDGTAAGTVLAQDIAEGTGESSPSDLTLVGSKLYFVATTETSGRQLYVFDTTAANLPTVQIAPVSSLAATSATFQGTVVSDGGSVITTRGMVYAPTSLNADPQIGGIGVVQISSPGSLGTFSVSSTNLSPGTSYNFRAYATNANGTACSSLGTFSTLTTLNQAESWRNNAFGSPQNFGDAADLADPDKDGISNLLERAFNLSPVQAGVPILASGTGTAGLPRVQTTTGPGGVTGLSVQYVRLKASTNPGIIYLPEFSSNLSAFWSAASGLESVESIDSNWERVTIQDNSTGQRARFGRVKVSTTPE
jgi:ELWxxDGT repeat protein